jgi:hypothetical protein
MRDIISQIIYNRYTFCTCCGFFKQIQHLFAPAIPHSDTAYKDLFVSGRVSVYCPFDYKPINFL